MDNPSTQYLICLDYKDGHGRAQHHTANADRLCKPPEAAAAPALLEALQAILPYTEPLIQSGDVLGMDIARIAKDAIALATQEVQS